MPPTYFQNLSSEEQCDFLKNIDTILTDCDGVIWLEKNAINGAADTLNYFQSVGKDVIFISNSSTKRTPQYAQKFKKLCFEFKEENILVTAPLVGKYVEENMDKFKSVYVIGSKSICGELSDRNIDCFGLGPDLITSDLKDTADLEKLELRKNVGAVVVGFDYHISYAKLIKAASYLKNPDCLFVATNTDDRFPCILPNYIMPGTGIIVGAVEKSSGRKATVLGKPNEYLSSVLKKMKKLDPQRTLMIGDRCDTDILFGKRNGFITLLVLTGVHNLNDVQRFENSENVDDQNSVPHYYIDSIKDLLPVMKKIYK